MADQALGEVGSLCEQVVRAGQGHMQGGCGDDPPARLVRGAAQTGGLAEGGPVDEQSHGCSGLEISNPHRQDGARECCLECANGWQGVQTSAPRGRHRRASLAASRRAGEGHVEAAQGGGLAVVPGGGCLGQLGGRHLHRLGGQEAARGAVPGRRQAAEDHQLGLRRGWLCLLAARAFQALAAPTCRPNGSERGCRENRQRSRGSCLGDAE
mmetsp:Transcript_3870/g.14386  ORF Transcript_3870/g.14386 Transcript_3870/m.14386 type:complete len:211 (+) Transcript_3870:1588-2220(+)